MPSVLVVEDDKDVAKALVLRLRSEGYRAVAVHDAAAGVTSAVNSHPDILLLDINMPAGGGLSVAARVSNMPDTADIPIIFLTATTSPEISAQADAFDPVALVEKPSDPKLLLDAISRAIAKPKAAPGND
jgi:CheY-like chemotaxis protein